MNLLSGRDSLSNFDLLQMSVELLLYLFALLLILSPSRSCDLEGAPWSVRRFVLTIAKKRANKFDLIWNSQSILRTLLKPALL